jgi:hypothetical protein
MSIPAEAFFTVGRRLCWCSNAETLEEEIARIKAVPFFKYEHYIMRDGRLQVIGQVYRNRKYGSAEYLRVRLDYPDSFPDEEPTVFDDDMHFRPSRDGHQFTNYALCLRFPFRRAQFGFTIETLGEEVLGAALSWLIKRNIFERTGEWPGDAEEHGLARPLAKLAREIARETGIYFLEVWAEFCITHAVVPKWDGVCPCLSGKRVNHCHDHLARMIEMAVIASRREVQSGTR